MLLDHRWHFSYYDVTLKVYYTGGKNYLRRLKIFVGFISYWSGRISDISSLYKEGLVLANNLRSFRLWTLDSSSLSGI